MKEYTKSQVNFHILWNNIVMYSVQVEDKSTGEGSGMSGRWDGQMHRSQFALNSFTSPSIKPNKKE